VVRDDLDKLAQGITSGDVDAEVVTLAPKAWDDLSSEIQSSIEEAYKEKEFPSVLEGEKQSYFDNGNALDDTKSMLVQEFIHSEFKDGLDGKKVVVQWGGAGDVDWIDTAISDYREERDGEELPEIPYTNEQLIKAITVARHPWVGGLQERPVKPSRQLAAHCGMTRL
jgi:hypothetical protein